MATKGASNRYGNSRGGSLGHITEHTGFAWAKGFNRTTVAEHQKRHGSQVEADSVESYIAHSVKFANTVDRKDCVSFIDERGSTYKYNKKTNEFAIITKKGIIVTYYKPEKGYKYYLKEKKKRGRKNRENQKI